ncbi:MAG: SPOR domain-containing protein [Bacteroidota bacterium]
MYKIFFLLFVWQTSLAFGQAEEWWKTEGGDDEKKATKDTTVTDNPADTTFKDTVFEPGEVSIEKDPRIDKLIDFKAAKIPPANGPQIDGFRVQLFFDQSREKVDEARSKILKSDAEAETYIEYKAPNYNLLLGDFRTRLEAEKERDELIDEFPEAIIVKDRIYFPEIEKEE